MKSIKFVESPLGKKYLIGDTEDIVAAVLSYFHRSGFKIKLPLGGWKLDENQDVPGKVRFVLVDE